MNIALEKDTVIHIPIKNSLICTYAILSIFGVPVCFWSREKFGVRFATQTKLFTAFFFFYIITALPV